MMRTVVRLLVWVCIALPLAAQETLTPELLWKLQRLSDPQLSPDGKWLLYHQRSYELAKNKGTTHVWLMELATKRAIQLTRQGSNFNARWSPDGKEIALLSTRDGAPQIYRMSLTGGEARRITEHEGGVSNMAWSPSGAHFSFTAAVQLDQTIRERHPDLPHADAKVYDDLMVRHWDEWKDGTYSHLFVVSSDGGDATDLMEGQKVDTPLKPFGGGEQITWARDGKSLVYTAKRSEELQSSTNSDLFWVKTDGSGHMNLTAGMPGYEINPIFSPDGSKLAFESMARDGYESDRNRIMVRDMAAKTTVEATTGWDLSSTEYAWDSNGRRLFACADFRGTRQVFMLSADGGGEPVAVTKGRFHFGSVQVGDGELICTRMQTERPNELVRVKMSGDRSGELLTDVNGEAFAKLRMPTVEERWFDATDGKKIHSWVIYPPGFDRSKKYPMLTYCQGGPQSQVGQWFSYRWNFHLMAAQGYIVLAVNRRGLPGFGTKWNEQISRDWGGQAMQDLLSATDGMFEESFVDREHTAAIGASFGGYTVYWLMGHDEKDRFCSMIAHCGVFNLESMYLSTEELFFVNWDLGEAFWANADVRRDYQRFSPHNYIDKWDTPLLVIHGQKDFRVPLEQGLQAFTAAQERGVPSRLLYFPAESHWVLSPQNGVLWHREFFAWLDRYCKPGQPSSLARPAAHGDVDGAVEPKTPKGKEIEKPVDRKHLLEQVDDTAIAQLYADGFDELTLQEKVLCYHLSQAAIAGRDIFIDQKFAFSLPVRDVLELLYIHREALEPEVAKEIERYTKLFWVHNGIHHSVSSRKMLLGLTLSQFSRAMDAARKVGADFATGLSARLLHKILTSPELYASVTNKSPDDGGDPVEASCNNLYVGVGSKDLEGFEEKYPLNSRVVLDRRTGKIQEEVYRIGDPKKEIPAGRYADQLREVRRHLYRAAKVAPKQTQNAIYHLARYYGSGSSEDWRRFNIAWVRDTNNTVDFINGFIEVYMDVRGQRGAWESVVSFVNKEKTKAIESLAKQAQWFEDRMPWDARFKKKNVKGITARAISVITETGDSGPTTPIGINLPNEADIRENYGSKSVNLSNVVEGYNQIRSGGSLEEFAWSKEEIARAKAWGQVAGDIHTNLHEVVGHASGQLMPEVKNPASKLGLYYSALEEARADLVGLYWIGDPQLIEMGIVPHPDAAVAEYEGYARNALVQLRRVELGRKLEDNHMRNRQVIVLWLIDNTEAIQVRKRDGKTYLVVTDPAAFRKGCGDLLAEVMRIKATGDYKAGKALMEKYGTNVDPTLHAEVLDRIAKLGLASVTGFVQPELEAKRDADGKIVDVTVRYPMDLADQMLRWSGKKQ